MVPPVVWKAVHRHQVSGLDVPVHNACAVRLCQPLPHLRRDVQRVVHGQRPSSDLLLQRLPLVVGHDEI